MRRLAWLVVALSALGAGCSTGTAPPEARTDPQASVETTSVQLQHEGVDRTFRVTAPADARNEELPVLVGLHGAGGSAVTLSYLTEFDLAVEDARFVLVEPDGTGPDPGSRTWNAGNCCGSSVGTVDDIGFLDAMLDRVAAEFSVDEERVYLAGFSNGGMLAYRAACELGERLAGIAVVAGTMNVEDCPAPAPVPVLAIHGTDDTVVPFEGGESGYADPRVEPWYNTPVEEALGFWVERNGCPSDAYETAVGAARVIEWDGCSVELWIVQEGRHTWFGSPVSAGSGLEPADTPSATDAALDFFGLRASPRASAAS